MIKAGCPPRQSVILVRICWRHLLVSSRKGERREGETLSAGGLGVSPRISLTSLGWEGGKKSAHVAATTPTPPSAPSAPLRNAAGFIPQTVRTEGECREGEILSGQGSGGVPQNQEHSWVGGWEEKRPCYGHHADAARRAQRPQRSIHCAQRAHFLDFPCGYSLSFSL
jgi:hypothetical protein